MRKTFFELISSPNDAEPAPGREGWHAALWCHLDTAAHSLPNQTSTKSVVPFYYLE